MLGGNRDEWTSGHIRGACAMPLTTTTLVLCSLLAGSPAIDGQETPASPIHTAQESSPKASSTTHLSHSGHPNPNPPSTGGPKSPNAPKPRTSPHSASGPPSHAKKGPARNPHRRIRHVRKSGRRRHRHPRRRSSRPLRRRHRSSRSGAMPAKPNPFRARRPWPPSSPEPPRSSWFQRARDWTAFIVSLTLWSPR